MSAFGFEADPFMRLVFDLLTQSTGKSPEEQAAIYRTMSQALDERARQGEEEADSWGDAWNAAASGEVRTWLTDRGKPRRYLVVEHNEKSSNDDGVIPLGKVGMLAAGGAVGKTQVLLQLALGVAAGGETGRRLPWLGKFEVNEWGDVLVILAEEDAEEAQRRVYDNCELLKLTDEERDRVTDRCVILPLCGKDVSLTRALDPRDHRSGLPTTENAVRLMKRLKESKRANGTPRDWRLIVLDPLSRFAGPDVETDNSAATKFVQVLESITKAQGGPTVLVGHHTNKSDRQSKAEGIADDTGARGSSGLTDGMRWHALMKSLNPKDGFPSYVRFSLVKSNYTRPGIECFLERGFNGVLKKPDKDTLARYREKKAQGPDGTDKPRRGNGSTKLSDRA